jgi:hypothetical protein
MKLISRLSALVGAVAFFATTLAFVPAATAASKKAGGKTTAVHGYTRKTKSGKLITVKGYKRSAAKPKTTAVKGYTRTTKSGKVITVKGYKRSAPKGKKAMKHKAK